MIYSKKGIRPKKKGLLEQIREGNTAGYDVYYDSHRNSAIPSAELYREALRGHQQQMEAISIEEHNRRMEEIQEDGRRYRQEQRETMMEAEHRQQRGIPEEHEDYYRRLREVWSTSTYTAPEITHDRNNTLFDYLRRQRFG